MRAWPESVKKGTAVPTAFIDRDGTLNRDRAGAYITRPSQLRIYAGAPAALRLISAKGYRIVVITNQSGVARGYMTLSGSIAINLKLVRDLRLRGARVDAIYFCPHGPGENCACRKPATGLIREAVKDSPADMARSFVAGDKGSDLQLAKKAGLKGFLVLTGQGKSAAADAPAHKDLLALARALPNRAKSCRTRLEKGKESEKKNPGFTGGNAGAVDSREAGKLAAFLGRARRDGLRAGRAPGRQRRDS